MLETILGKMSTIGFYTWDLLKVFVSGVGILFVLHVCFQHIKHNADKEQARVREVKQEQARKYGHHNY